MGFSRHQAESAIQQYESVQQALDSLLAGYGKHTATVGANLSVNGHSSKAYSSMDYFYLS